MLWNGHEAIPINWTQYHYWMRHILPFGWAILSEPPAIPAQS